MPRRHVVVLAVPASVDVGTVEARAALPEHLALAVGLPPDGVVTQQEAQREDPAPHEARLVPTTAHQVDAVAALPAAHLRPVPGLRPFEMEEALTGVVAGREVVVGRLEVQQLEVDGVEPHGVDLADGVDQTQTRPRALAKFVGVVVHEPVGIERRRELLLAPQDRRPRNPCAVRPVEKLAADEAGAAKPLGEGPRSVRRTMVENIEIDTRTLEVLEYAFEDIGLVVRRDQGDHSRAPSPGALDITRTLRMRRTHADLPSPERHPRSGADPRYPASEALALGCEQAGTPIAYAFVDRLRVLHVTPYFERAWGYGGIPRVAATACRALAQRGHDVTVCTTDACDAQQRLPLLAAGSCKQASDVDIRIFPNVSNRIAYRTQFFLPRGLRGFLREHAADFDVAHIHGFHHLPGAIAARELHRVGVPYVVHPNGTARRIERRRLAKHVFDATLGRRVLRDAKRAIAVTEVERGHLEALGCEPRDIRILPNSLDLREFQGIEPLPEAAFGLPREVRRVVAYLGQLTPRKRVDTLLHAVATLGPEVGLVVAGNDGGCESSLRQLAAGLCIERRVRFLGVLEGRARLEFLAAADAVAYAGHDEIFGLVPLEALLCGTPVVVANDSGCAEVVRGVDGGPCVPPGDPMALASALVRLLSTGSRPAPDMKMIQENIRANFSSDQIASRLESIYGELVPGVNHQQDPWTPALTA